MTAPLMRRFFSCGVGDASRPTDFLIIMSDINMPIKWLAASSLSILRRWPFSTWGRSRRTLRLWECCRLYGRLGWAGRRASDPRLIFIALKPLGERKISASAVVDRLCPGLQAVRGASTCLQASQDLSVGGRDAAQQSADNGHAAGTADDPQRSTDRGARRRLDNIPVAVGEGGRRKEAIGLIYATWPTRVRSMSTCFSAFQIMKLGSFKPHWT